MSAFLSKFVVPIILSLAFVLVGCGALSAGEYPEEECPDDTTEDCTPDCDTENPGGPDDRQTPYPPNPGNPDETTSWVMFIQSEVPLHVGEYLTSSILFIENSRAIVNIVVRNSACSSGEIAIATNPSFTITAISQGIAYVYVYARLATGEIEYRRIRIIVSE